MPDTFTALLLPALLSTLNWFEAVIFNVAGDGEDLVSSRKTPGTLSEKTFAALSVTAPESMMIAPVSVVAVLMLSTLRALV